MAAIKQYLFLRGDCLKQARLMLTLLMETERVIHLNPDAAVMQLRRAISMLNANNHDEPSQRNATGVLAQWQIARVNDFIERHLGRCIRTKELASLLSLSTSYFSQLFKQTVGMTPLMYVAARRVEAAGQYMLCSESSLSEIALSYGFCDQSHFCRVFKREKGLSPQTWRKLNRPRIRFIAAGSTACAKQFTKA